jgi:hypothetical protein
LREDVPELGVLVSWCFEDVPHFMRIRRSGAFLLYFVFSLAERKNEIQYEQGYHAAAGKRL